MDHDSRDWWCRVSLAYRVKLCQWKYGLIIDIDRCWRYYLFYGTFEFSDQNLFEPPEDANQFLQFNPDRWAVSDTLGRLPPRQYYRRNSLRALLKRKSKVIQSFKVLLSFTNWVSEAYVIKWGLSWMGGHVSVLEKTLNNFRWNERVLMKILGAVELHTSNFWVGVSDQMASKVQP
jgi:hypothetical protein